MDPQQRLLLEGAWEALEDAGIDPASLRGSATGVYAGIMNHEYGIGEGPGAAPELEIFLGGNGSGSVASGRISYVLGLEGPAMTVDTACSSSLVATHLAAQALRSGECDLALAGGVTVMATPALFVGMSRQGSVAPDGRCKSFAASADGAGFGEGMGLLALERLSDAKRNGRRVLAVIRGSATNQDGASNGLTAPNGPSQERVIRQALANAGLTPAEVDAVEAHGTGTTLGDPIEAQALLATYGQERDGSPLALGSLKSNLGHTQAAAGVGGVIKMVMALREEALPKTLHVDEPSPHVDWSAGEIELLTEPREWKRGDRPRRAGVSSFGISGTNAHLILEEAPEQPQPERDEQSRPPAIPWALSAKAPEALAEMAGRLAAHVEQADPDPLDVAHTLLASRASLPHRAVVVGKDASELLEGLDALAQGTEHPRLARGKAAPRSKLAFVFPGQGSQWAQMAAGLLDESSVFAESIERCEAALAPHVDFSVKDVLRDREGAWLDRIEVVQPALFAVMVSLAELCGSFGVRPSAVIGHSQGEIAAAVVAGALSLEDGAKVAALRAKALISLMGEGEMASFALSPTELEPLIAPYGERVAIAAHNGPRSTVCSGEPEALGELVGACEERGTRARLIPVGYASHCAQIERIEAELLEAIADVKPRQAEIPIHSTLTGEPIAGTELTPAYWYRNLREPVRFHEASEKLIAEGHTAFLEISSHPVLTLALTETVEANAEDPSRIAVLHSLRREEGDLARFLTSLGQAHSEGVEVDLASLTKAGTLTELPTYPFQRQRYWLEAKAGAGDPSGLGQSATDHPLLGASISLASEGSHLFTGRISQKTHAWIADHAVAGNVLLPGTAFAELALRAGREIGAERLEELVLEAPLILPEEGATQLQVSVCPQEADPERFALEIHSRPEAREEDQEEEERPWTRHASGALSPQTEPLRLGFDPTSWPPPGAEPIDTEAFYDLLAAAGIEYGPAFQGMEAAWRLGEEIYAEVSLAEEQRGEAERFAVHPALLDAALHPAIAALDRDGGLRLPFGWNGVWLDRGEDTPVLRVRARVEDERIEVEAARPDGSPAFSVEALSLRMIDPDRLPSARRPVADLHGLEWRPVVLPAEGEEDVRVHRVAAPSPDRDPGASVREVAGEVLAALQSFLAAEPADGTRLAVVTEGAMAVAPGERPDPAAAAVWGLVRSAQLEHPGRFVLVDTDGREASDRALEAAVAQGDEPQLALRGGETLVPRLTSVEAGVTLPEQGAWRLEHGEDGTLESLGAVAAPEAERELGSGEVRVAVRAAGINFRDSLISLGLSEGRMGDAPIGGEGAGVVVEVGSGVGDLVPGDRVFGLIEGAFGPLAVADRRYLAGLPEDWSFAEGASVPIAFGTAWFGLVEVAGLRPGERVLIHAGAGGVGMAAIQIARGLGAEVFATASPAKWPALRQLGLEDDHIASSRTLEFRDEFLAATEGEGVDVVLNSLAGEFVDASLELLPRGGRFAEMGKTDIREPERVAAEHAGVAYTAFDLLGSPPERFARIYGELVTLFESGGVAHLPIAAWDARRVPDALRFLAQARHVGKLIASLPSRPDPEGTVLVTGGFSGVGRLTALHLAKAHGARRIVLAGRRGPATPGADELLAELGEHGCEATAVACDVADRDQVEALLAAIPADRPLTAVFHAAAALDDGTIATLDGERLATALAAKAEGAWLLHELTAAADLSAFVLYSSAAGVIGAPGQGNYAAANAFLDALAGRRRAEGRPATAIAWGLWEERSEATAGLDKAELARMGRIGLGALATDQGLELLDRVQALGEPFVLGAPLDLATLRAAAREEALPPLLSSLVPQGRRRARPAGALGRRLATLSPEEREALVAELVRDHAVAVLGQSSATAIDLEVPFKQLGFDSLAAVELRNRLARACGVRLAATLVFDHPTPHSLAAHLLERLEGSEPSAAGAVRAARGSEEPIAIVAASCRYPGGVDSPKRLWELVAAAGRDGESPRRPTERGWEGGRFSGGFLGGAAEFDPAFFSISPREALTMDPQHRLLLEGAWEALENAGIDPANLRGSATGVFAGIAFQDYAASVGASSQGEGYLGTGVLGSVASGRISYALGLEGPAVTVDTACSSSLVATHLAAQALRSGECDLALAGGATVMATPSAFLEMSTQQGLAADGRCKAFAASADGTGFAEGMGLLALERLSDAKRNGRRVLAVIRGSATNQDGASNGLTAPSGRAQERVIRQALANAGLTPAEVDAVEAHGTGTTLGDPIEAQALLATYGQERGGRALALGSLKSNLGHTQAAAGVGGVIKMVMALREEALPKTLHVDEPSPHVDWSAGEIELLTEQREWKRGDRPRRAGVSSFGIAAPTPT